MRHGEGDKPRLKELMNGGNGGGMKGRMKEEIKGGMKEERKKLHEMTEKMKDELYRRKSILAFVILCAANLL
jgi:hypothetical protein